MKVAQNEDDSSSFSKSAPIANADSLQLEYSRELYVRSNAVVSRLVAGETLVLPIRHNVGDLTSLFSFNGTGATIWNALETPSTLQDICDVIDGKYDLSREKVEEDVALFMDQICSLGLAERVVDSEAAPPTGER